MKLNTNVNEPQYQMTDEFYHLVKRFLKDNNLMLRELCKIMKTDYYMVRKIMDRKIKMHAYLSFLEKIAKYCGISLTIRLGEFQSTRMSFPSQAKPNNVEIAQKKRTTN